MAYLEIKNFRKSFGKTEVLKGIDFELNKGEVLSIIGSSGSGKTTLLRCINFLETPDAGDMVLDGKTLLSYPAKQKTSDSALREKRLNFGLVFQSFNLFPQYTALENVTLARLLNMKTSGETVAQIVQDGIRLLSMMGLKDRADFYPQQLSGGQQQRVAIARACVANPKLILADEPTGNLDSKNGKEVMELLQELNNEGATIVMVTHSQKDAAMAQRTIDLFDGKIVSDVKNEL